MNNIIYNANTKTFNTLKNVGDLPCTLIFIDSDVVSNKQLIKGLRKEIPHLEIKVLNYSLMPMEFDRKEYTKAFFNSIFSVINYIHIDEDLSFVKSSTYVNHEVVTNIIVDSPTFVEFKDEYLNSFVQNIRINEKMSTPSTLAVKKIINECQNFAEGLESILSTGADVSKVAKILHKLK